jgi:hypothetical protein
MSQIPRDPKTNKSIMSIAGWLHRDLKSAPDGTVVRLIPRQFLAVACGVDVLWRVVTSHISVCAKQQVTFLDLEEMGFS